MALTAGKKPNWARNIDSDNFQDIYGLAATDAQKLGLVEGKAVIDSNGTKRIILVCTSFETSELTWANYANVPIGSRVYMPLVTTPGVWLKKANAGATTDWLKQAINTAA